MSRGRRLVVRHALGRYPVLIEPGISRRLASAVAALAPGRPAVLVTDRLVSRVVPVGGRWPSIVVPRGEAAKSRRVWATVTDALLARRVGRDAVVVSLGGGAVSDLAGFVAATYLRGIPFIAVPTTLLAMVDASVGGKTGVNSRFGKNLVGSFWPPIGVVVDPEVLRTLAAVHYRGGLIEAMKHGLVADRGYLRWILRNRDRLIARDPGAVGRLVARSVAIKAAIVERDERERGPRATLNAGHTVGHAIEQATGYRIGHGDAVALGLVAETLLAERLGWRPDPTAAELADWLAGFGCPLRWPSVSDRALLGAMGRDKKSTGGAIGMALPRGDRPAAGRRGRWTAAVDRLSVRQALGDVRRLLASRLPTRYQHRRDG